MIERMERRPEVLVSADYCSTSLERRVWDQPDHNFEVMLPEELGLSADLANRLRAWQRWHDEVWYLCGHDARRQLAGRVAADLGPAVRVAYVPQTGWCRTMGHGKQLIVQERRRRDDDVGGACLSSTVIA
jgi:hypothetical protein